MEALLRIISLCPSNSEILFAIGAGDQVIAVEKWTDYPPEAARLPKVGTELKVDIDLVCDLRPDLVVASLSVPGMETTVSALEESSLPFMVLDPHSIEEIYDDIFRVGKAVGCEQNALEVVRHMQREIEASRELYGLGRPNGKGREARVYLEWWPRPAITPGRKSWTDAMIRAAGGRNIFSDIAAPSGPVEYGEVVTRDPEIILLCWAGIHKAVIQNAMNDPAFLSSREGWGGINAVRGKRIHVVDEGWYGRPGPRIVLGIRQMAALIAALDE